MFGGRQINIGANSIYHEGGRIIMVFVLKNKFFVKTIQL